MPPDVEKDPFILMWRMNTAHRLQNISLPKLYTQICTQIMAQTGKPIIMAVPHFLKQILLVDTSGFSWFAEDTAAWEKSSLAYENQVWKVFDYKPRDPQ